jgi:hypothetical protein
VPVVVAASVTVTFKLDNSAEAVIGEKSSMLVRRLVIFRFGMADFIQVLD